MTTETSATENAYIARAVEASINIGLVALLAAVCLLILAPFVPIVAWGIIIAVASYPVFLKLQHATGRGGWAAAIWTILLLAVLIVPVVLLANSMVEGVQSLMEHLDAGTFVVPPPPPNLESWPLIGAPLNRIWSMASNNLTEAVKLLAPQIKTFLPKLLSATAGIGLTVLQFFFSILIAGALLAKAQSAAEVTRAFTNRLFGERGAGVPEPRWFHHPQCDLWHSRGSTHSNRAGCNWFSRRGIAGSGLVGRDLSHCRCPADRNPRTHPRSRLRLRYRHNHHGRCLPDLVRVRRFVGQRAEAHPAGPWSLGSDRRGLPRRHRRVRCDGDHRPVRRRNRIVGGLQTVSRLGRAQQRRINQYRGRVKGKGCGQSGSEGRRNHDCIRELNDELDGM